ncbi:cytochrome c-type biogenesis protein CcmH [Yersinia pekkanenii]|uniref:cytochrome c-type biogenesis protein CcmH n=1 Tax=Yersinia pekkanenii TaxID=1288385 RepID=UPI000B22381E|nr:cytochrome c-type biogenesis protein CcmH [Yersinia pekkanenii]
MPKSKLLESTSPIAQDLRLEIYRLVEAGHSSQEIMAVIIRALTLARVMQQAS